MYNIHPRLYFDLAQENNYEIRDFQYIDNHVLREWANYTSESTFEFPPMIQLILDANIGFLKASPSFTSNVGNRLLENCRSSNVDTFYNEAKKFRWQENFSEGTPESLKIIH